MGWSHRHPPKRSPIPVYRGPSAEQYAKEEEQRAKRLAMTFGLCPCCGVDVGTDGIHAWDCTRVPTERRANRGRQP